MRAPLPSGEPGTPIPAPLPAEPAGHPSRPEARAGIGRAPARGRLLGRSVRALVVLAVAVAGLLAVRLVVVSRPFMGGVDFYYYVVTARDLVAGAPDVSLVRYFYFPGVYTFWEFVFRVTDGSLASLQWAFASVLCANAVLVGAILWALTGARAGGGLAAAVYLFQASRLEGFIGAAEPIATVPFLLGTGLWIALDRAAWDRTGLLALGAGMGLALFVRQQAGLLSLGAIALLPGLWASGSPHRLRMSRWLLVPAAAAAVFATAITLEGGGLEAVKAGLLGVQSYEARGTWLRSVARVHAESQPISGFFLAGCALWLAVVIAGRGTAWTAHPAMPAFGLCALSGLASLLQFWKRGYFHYALLVLPSAILTAGLAIDFARRWLGRITGGRWRVAGPAIAVGAAALAWLNFAGTARFVEDVAAQLASPVQWTTGEMGPLAPVCAATRPGEALLLIPPRENRIHWLCRTRPMDLTFTHSWEATAPDRYTPLLAVPTLNQVLILAADRGPYERYYFQVGDWQTFLRELDRQGFRETLGSRDGRLFRRAPR